MVLTPAVDVLATDWYRRVRESQCAHYECGKMYDRLNRLVGIPTIILSATVATTVFATFDHSATGRMRLILGSLSVAATVLASLQTFMTFAERADRHRLAGSKYGSIRRDLELLRTFPPSVETEVQKTVEAIKKKLDDLASSAPHIPSRIKESVDRRFKDKVGIIFKPLNHKSEEVDG